MTNTLNILVEQMVTGTERMIWNVQSSMPPLRQQIWVHGLREITMVRGTWDLGYLFDSSSTWMIAPKLGTNQTVFRCLELFAGAFGGWKGALEVLSRQHVHYQSVGIEIEERASKA